MSNERFAAERQAKKGGLFHPRPHKRPVRLDTPVLYQMLEHLF